jgi:ABC-2 type transport system permease protein
MAERAAAPRQRANGLGTGQPALLSRVYGLGSVFGKTLLDMRGAVVVVGLVFAAITVGTATQVAMEFDTVESRRLLVEQMQLLPAIFHGLLGEPINIETLPGFLSWRLMGFMPLLIGIWAIVALSGTLAGEAARGTLELVLATPVSRLSLALQKFAAVAVGVTIALVISAILTWLGTLAFAALPGDEAALGAVLAEFGFVLAISLLFGSLAFALGPLLGRALAAGTAAATMFTAYMVNGYADLVPGFDVLRVASPFYWTTQHRPMAGVSDWPALALVFGLAAIFAAVGLLLFKQRDLASTVSLPRPARAAGLTARTGRWSLAGPGRRSLGERLPSAIGWGAGLGMYGFVIAVSAEEFGQVLSSLPQLSEIVERFYPGIDLSTAGGLLQLAMFNFAALIVGLATATLIDSWAADETDRRLEIVLAAPLQRVAWALRSGLGVMGALLILVLVMAVGIALGAAVMGDPVAGPISGALVLGLYAAALAGVGLLVAGLGWPGRAGLVVTGLAIGMWLLEFIGSAVGLPGDVLNLALTRHLGRPMVGSYNEVGMLISAGIALGGLVLGALAFKRRDVRG